MWCVISTSLQLRFYDIDGRVLVLDDFNNENIEISSHNQLVSDLLSAKVPLFIKKTDAREFAVSKELLGFKYLQLKPTIIVCQ